jgi:RimJ/RimL family protein N-acetyltransferase
MTEQDLINAPRMLRTERTVLLSPNAEQIPHRMAWAVANHDALGFLPHWRRSADRAVAERSAASEMASVLAGTELIFNAFTHTGEYVGRIDLHSWEMDVPRCEIGYMGDVRTGGQGLLREAAGEVLRLAFALGCARVHAITDVDNHRSIRCAQALGLQTEGVLKAWERDDNGALRDQVMLACVAKPR